MTALKKNFMMIFLVTGGFFLYRNYMVDMTIIYPDACVFTIDKLFCRAQRLEIKAFIDAAYQKNKNPSSLLPAIEHHFSQIKSIVIDMHNPESLHFTIQAFQPICLVNDQMVICQYGKLFDKKIFDWSVLKKLENISFAGTLSDKNSRRIVDFFNTMPIAVTQEFSIRWIDKDAIWLDSKVDKNFSLMIGLDIVIQPEDIAQCKRLVGAMQEQSYTDRRGKIVKKIERWVCDLRFDRQIILFSTNQRG